MSWRVGGLVAIAGHKQFTIQIPTMLAEYYCWYQRPRHDPVRDVQRFTNDSVKFAGAVAGAVAIAAAGAALIGGVIILETYLPDECDNDDEFGFASDSDRRASHSHRDDHDGEKNEHRKKKKKE